MDLGVCYFPEHWPRETWADDAARMRDLGLRFVRIGEFSWSATEPSPGSLSWGWLDESFAVLAEAGLEVVLCTPTATPPKWLIDRHPDILQMDAQGRTRGFGSRRHYCANNATYRRETERIVSALAERYGTHPALKAWQTDNEYGCHDTIRCYCEDCRAAFRTWLADRYGDVDALNEAWWTSFWSQTYRSFDEIDPPNLTVTEPNPSHQLDFFRFSSDSVVAYNRLQVETIRKHSPAPVSHNLMILFGDLDAHALGIDLDFVTWDSYPLGMLEQSSLPEDIKTTFARTGHPDLVSLHHDLYRGVKDKPFWVMEQQPGQVNWASTNPLPADGAVRLWTHQAFAHGAEVVSYFRWRQALGAQEMMHAGLDLPDGRPGPGSAEAARAAGEIPRQLRGLPMGSGGTTTDSVRPVVALVFDYESLWATGLQPHSRQWSYWGLQFSFYTALRSLGVDVDIIPVGRDPTAYRAVIAPALHLVDAERAAWLGGYVASVGHLVLGPRTGAKTMTNLAHTPSPGPLRELGGVRIDRVDALRPGLESVVTGELGRLAYHTWADLLEPETATVVATYSEPAYLGAAAITRHEVGAGVCMWIGAWLETASMQQVLASISEQAGIGVVPHPDGVRTSRIGRPATYNFSDLSAAVGTETVSSYNVTFLGPEETESPA